MRLQRRAEIESRAFQPIFSTDSSRFEKLKFLQFHFWDWPSPRVTTLSPLRGRGGRFSKHEQSSHSQATSKATASVNDWQTPLEKTDFLSVLASRDIWTKPVCFYSNGKTPPFQLAPINWMLRTQNEGFGDISVASFCEISEPPSQSPWASFSSSPK